ARQPLTATRPGQAPARAPRTTFEPESSHQRRSGKPFTLANMYRHAVARDGTSWATPALLVLLALGARLLGLDRKSVWFDEAITYLDAHEPWPRLLEAVRA